MDGGRREEKRVEMEFRMDVGRRKEGKKKKSRKREKET
jgi:hypothetical protein